MVLEQRPDGRIIVVTGSSGSGKTLLAMRECSPVPRLLVWDADLQWSSKGAQACSSIAALAARCGTRESAHLAFTGAVTSEAFEGFCRVAFCWVRLAPATIVVEELAAVTSPGKAPVAWGELVRRGRKYGATVYAITQRPAESDKTAIANAHRIVCLQMRRAGDRRYMAEELGVDSKRLEQLKPLEYLDRCGPGEPQFGRVRIPRPQKFPANPVRAPDPFEQIRTDPE